MRFGSQDEWFVFKEQVPNDGCLDSDRDKEKDKNSLEEQKMGRERDLAER